MIAAMSVQTIYNLVDAIWVSGIGADALAAIGFVYPFFFLAMGLSNGLGVGAGSAISRRIGARDKPGADNVAVHTIVIMLLFAVAFTIPFFVLAHDIFALIGAGKTTGMTVAYGRVIFAGSIFIFFTNVANSILRSEGDARRAMYAMALGAGLNIVLDPIFIYYFGLGSDSAVLKNEINNTMGWLKYGETRTATPGITEPGVLATITFHAIDDIDGLSELKFTVVKLSDPKVNLIPANISNGSVEITDSQSGIAIFDTGAPDSPYPSIMGVHNGTITPNRRIEVNRIYTYACPGTGGHTEYARIWGNGVDAHANWSGYTGNWHNLKFNTAFTLEPGKEYNYTIRTGSYPQIIHHPGEYNATGGKIACNEFIDANGKKYTGWIPAIKLWWEEE